MCAEKRIPYVLPFLGAANFRDLGGYPAQGGRRVKYRCLYRGSALLDLESDEDWALLKSLGLKLVLDLRSVGECAQAPDPVPVGTRYLQISAMRYPDGEELDFSPAGMERMERELAAIPGARNSLEAFAGVYAWMPFGNPAFQALFRAMEEGEVPLLFHCAAGKDRTGVAAMLILLALGADRETALRDYLETNRCYAASLQWLREQYPDLAQRDPEKWEDLMGRYGVTPLCGNAALDAILDRYGGWEPYFEAEFGLTPPRLAALRDRYLEG